MLTTNGTDDSTIPPVPQPNICPTCGTALRYGLDLAKFMWSGNEIESLKARVAVLEAKVAEYLGDLEDLEEDET